jgi:hypothetical protein
MWPQVKHSPCSHLHVRITWAELRAPGIWATQPEALVSWLWENLATVGLQNFPGNSKTQMEFRITRFLLNVNVFQYKFHLFYDPVRMEQVGDMGARTSAHQSHLLLWFGSGMFPLSHVFKAWFLGRCC